MFFLYLYKIIKSNKMIIRLEYLFLPLFVISIIFLFFGNMQFAAISFGIAVLLFAKKRHRQKRKSTYKQLTINNV